MLKKWMLLESFSIKNHLRTIIFVRHQSEIMSIREVMKETQPPMLYTLFTAHFSLGVLHNSQYPREQSGSEGYYRRNLTNGPIDSLSSEVFSC